MDNELIISGVGISEEVATSIITDAVRQVAGVASVGERDLISGITSGLVSLFTQQPSVAHKAVECSVAEEGLLVSVHVAAFFGYHFDRLAADIRAAVARAVNAQMSVPTAAVNVFIDDLVFAAE